MLKHNFPVLKKFMVVIRPLKLPKKIGLGGSSTSGVIAISPEGDVYVIRVNKSSTMENSKKPAKVVQHFNLRNSKSETN